MIIDEVRKWMRKCPLVKGKKVNVDYLGADIGAYTIDVVPAEPIVKTYTDGSTIRQFLFVFGSKEAYSADVLQNIENNGFFEKLQEWFEEQNRINSFPKLGTGKKAIKVEVTSTGYLFDESEDRARYQCQCKLSYYQDIQY